MHRIKLVAAISLLSASTIVNAQDDVSVRATELVPGITMLEGAGGFIGGNVAVITGDEAVVLIDGGVEPYGELVLEAVEQHTKATVDYLINTHVHGDHLASNKILHMSGTTVIAHDNIRKRLVEFGVRTGTGFRPAEFSELPELTFADAVTLHLNNFTAHVFHTPMAHTDGDSVIHFPGANVIHAGDTFFNGLFPYIDLDTGGGVQGFIAAQRMVLELADDETRIIPGHGPLANKADLQAAVEMLVDSNERIKALLDSGVSAEDIIARNPLADYHDSWSWDFITTERMTQTLIRANSSD